MLLRVMGLENEYGAMLEGKSGRLYRTKYPGITARIKKFADECGAICCTGPTIVKERAWLPNGSCFYEDVDHPEYATPECLSARDIVLYSRAGDLLARKIFPDFILYKDNLARAVKGEGLSNHGCHENYWTEFRSNDEIYHERSMALIMPFLISRQIFDGSGWVDEGGNFFLSQRAILLKPGTSPVCPAIGGDGRPVWLIKDGGVKTGNRYFERLQFSIGDTNVLDFALFLKISVTSLILSMFEDGELPDFNCGDVLEMAVNINEDVTGKLGLELQKFYLSAAKSYLRRSVRKNRKRYMEAEKIICLWSKTLESLETDDIDWLVGRVDHRTKRFFIEEMKRGKSDVSLRRKINLCYHKVSRGGLVSSTRKMFKDCQVVSDEETLRALMAYPLNTRAAMRGKIITELLRDPIFRAHHQGMNFEISWSDISLSMDHGLVPFKYDTNVSTAEVENPFDTGLSDSKRFLKEVKKLFAKIK